ncbi:MAG: sodium:alanine symporter family protein [Waddliaceae bacterium]
MEQLYAAAEIIRDFVWGVPTLLFLIGTGLYLTIILRGIQFRYLGYAFKHIFFPQKGGGEGDISNFEALMTSLASAIGTGAIVGVSTALVIGGAGSLFWMWVAGIFGMATKYGESLLAVKFRERDKRGEMIGGPMGYMEKGLGKKWLAILFAFLGVAATIGTGNLVQVNAIADAMQSVCGINPWLTGAATSAMTALIVLGGVKSIGRVTGILVPFMSLFYLIGGGVVLFFHASQIPAALWLMVTSAFQGQSAVGGMVGAGVMSALQMGVTRGVLSTEAGLGISSIASAAAKADSPSQQAIITMTGSLLSVLLVCTMTGLIIIVTGTLEDIDLSGRIFSGVFLVNQAFNSTLAGGEYLVSIGLILFAFSTMIAWAYYGEKCVEYLFGERAVLFFRLMFTLLVVPGAVIDLGFAWAFADIANALMAVPNLIALLGLSTVIVKETQAFAKDLKREKSQKKQGIAVWLKPKPPFQ